MRDYSEIQAHIDEITNTTQEERHTKQHRESQACQRRLEAMKIKREKQERRKLKEANHD